MLSGTIKEGLSECSAKDIGGGNSQSRQQNHTEVQHSLHLMGTAAKDMYAILSVLHTLLVSETV